MHITTRSLLAVKTLLTCAAEPQRLFRKHEIAAMLDASENHLAQVIHQLAQRGFLDTHRGRAGGLRLARPADKIHLGAVLRSFEQELPLIGLPLSECLTSKLRQAEEAFYSVLDSVSLADMAKDNSVMADIALDKAAMSIAAE